MYYCATFIGYNIYIVSLIYKHVPMNWESPQPPLWVYALTMDSAILDSVMGAACSCILRSTSELWSKVHISDKQICTNFTCFNSKQTTVYLGNTTKYSTQINYAITRSVISTNKTATIKLYYEIIIATTNVSRFTFSFHPSKWERDIV